MARGTNTNGDVLVQTIDGRPLNDIWAEFQQTLSLQNANRQKIVDLLTFPVTQPVENVPQITGDDFEEASEFGVPKGITGADYFSIGYTFKWYDLAVRYTWQYLAEATSAQVESLNNMALEADNRLVFNRILRTIFDNVNRTANIRGQSVNVYPFYNADGTVPPSYKGNTFSGSETHYLASGATTVDYGDLQDMEDKLSKKGYGKKNGSTLVLMVNRQELATIRTFRVASGAAYDFIPAVGQPPFLLPTNTGGIQGGQPANTFKGLDVDGTYGNWIIISDDYIPAGYLIGFATGGEKQATNPVGFREHANSNLHGLRLVKGRDNDYPLIDSYYNRGFGTGVRHRGAGVVLQITAGSYAIPAAYSAAL